MEAIDLHMFVARDGQPRCSVTAQDGERTRPVDLTPDEIACLRRIARRALHRLRQPDSHVVSARVDCIDATVCTAATDGDGAVVCS